MKHLRIKPPLLTSCDLCLIKGKEKVAIVRRVHASCRRDLLLMRCSSPHYDDMSGGSTYTDVCRKCDKNYRVFTLTTKVSV